MGSMKKNFTKVSNHIKKSVFLPPISQAEVAQLVEHNLAKVGVASSSLVFRSNLRRKILRLFLLCENDLRKRIVVFSVIKESHFPLIHKNTV